MNFPWVPEASTELPPRVSDAAGRQAWMSYTDSILPNVGPVVLPHQPVLPGMQLFYNTLPILALPYFFKDATC